MPVVLRGDLRQLPLRRAEAMHVGAGDRTVDLHEGTVHADGSSWHHCLLERGYGTSEIKVEDVPATVELLRGPSLVRARHLVDPNGERDVGDPGTQIGDRLVDCGRRARAGVLD